MKNLIFQILIFTVFISTVSLAQWSQPGDGQVINENYLNSKTGISIITDNASLRTLSQWRSAIDSVWGFGLPTSEKLRIFDSFWNRIDSAFACFNNIPDNWLSLKQTYRPEVAAGVSRGRFAAIMSVLSLALKEAHTKAQDNGVIYVNQFDPVFYIGGWGWNRFGAGLTPLPDSTLLVYKVVPNHPLGLEPGDIILGYDGVNWNTLANLMLSYQLPVRGIWGSSNSSFSHSLLISASVNYHLFETINIKKRGTDQLVNLPTSLMNGFNNPIFIDEQMDIPGVPKPNFNSGEFVSYGIVSGTNIGYIYCIQWTGNAGDQFYNAVNSLKNTNGLIIDFRTNFGGNMFLSDSAMKILFPAEITTIDFGRRTSPGNHTAMTSNNIWANYKIKGSGTGYSKPIAVLVGPGAVSSGDQVALKMKYHPRARFFGKSTNTAFNSPVNLNIHQDWFTRYSPNDAFELNTPNVYLTHREFPVDNSVWLTRDGAIQGIDNVVESAKDWINIFYGNSTVIFTDNAESGITKWVTNQGWGTVKSNATSPVNSFSDSPKGNYKNNADNTFTMKNSINVSNYSAVVLSFKHRYITQLDKDFCFVEVSSNNGTTWTQVYKFTGSVSSMNEFKIDITKGLNFSSNAKVRFRLKADASTIADGWYIDDINITGYNSNGMSPSNISGNSSILKYELMQNYPNPFNPETTIEFSLPSGIINENVSLNIYDMTGKLIRTLINQNMNEGRYSVKFNGKDLSSGIYFYKLTYGNFSETKRMMLVK